MNRINYTLACAPANPSVFLDWARGMDHIDLVDMDIQAAELELMLDPDVLAVLAEKAYRLIVATHTADIHARIADAYRDWIVIYQVPHSSVRFDSDCLDRYLRGYDDYHYPDRNNWKDPI